LGDNPLGQKSNSAPVHESISAAEVAGLNFLLETLRVGESEANLHLRLLSAPELRELISNLEQLGLLVYGLEQLASELNEKDERPVGIVGDMPQSDASDGLNFLCVAVRAGPKNTLLQMAKMEKYDRMCLSGSLLELYWAIADLQNAVADVLDNVRDKWQES
jgi:hypothetical protein